MRQLRVLWLKSNKLSRLTESRLRANSLDESRVGAEPEVSVNLPGAKCAKSAHSIKGDLRSKCERGSTGSVSSQVSCKSESSVMRQLFNFARKKREEQEKLEQTVAAQAQAEAEAEAEAKSADAAAEAEARAEAEAKAAAAAEAKAAAAAAAELELAELEEDAAEPEGEAAPPRAAQASPGTAAWRPAREPPRAAGPTR